MAPKWDCAGSSIVMIMVIGQLLLLITTQSSSSSSSALLSLSQTVSANCQATCGDVAIPYPFGTSQGCYLNEDFFIDCSTHNGGNSSDHVPEPFLWSSDLNFRVLNISLDGNLRVNTYVGLACYNGSGLLQGDSYYASAPLKVFSFSSVLNKFTAIGCSTEAYLQGSNGQGFWGGCLSVCNSIGDVKDGACNGIGCCQTAVPVGLRNYNASVSLLGNDSHVLSFSPCSFAFVVEEEAFNFRKGYLNGTGMNKSSLIPTMIEWAVWNETCETSFACKANSECIEFDFDQVTGYRCNCSPGYEGNPYLGCVDIDECADEEKNHCTANCTNTQGSYICSCPKGYLGNGINVTVGGQGCIPNPSHSHVLRIVVGVGVSFMALLLSSGFVYLGLKKRNLMRLKEKYFKQNGGLLLQQQLHERDNTSRTAKIFSAEELEKATDNYHESRIVGRGGYGTVYKGFLPDNTVIAIKKSKLVDQSQIEQFINEVVVLSQISHRSVVKLLGCCLETEVPLLVYEFVSNGTLSDHLHNPSKSAKMTWETRLRIATETAGVLSYLHSTAAIPIIHRDVKPTNILLDDIYTAKVSDFGTSRLVPLDQTQLCTMVQGTLGYLDPEYLHTSQLTEKSDVYSFGVVLVELMTGKKALSFDRPEEERCLAMHFLSSFKNGHLFEILEKFIVNEENHEQVKEVANLARRCLRVKGEERPSMKEVALELEGLRAMANHPWVDIPLDPEETVLLLGDTSYSGVYSDTGVGGFTYSMKNQDMPAVNNGR